MNQPIYNRYRDGIKCFMAALFVHFGCSIVTHAQVTGVHWEVDRVFYAEDSIENSSYAPLVGMVSYIIYADVANPTDWIGEVFALEPIGEVVHPLAETDPILFTSTSDCFNAQDGVSTIGLASSNSALLQEIFPEYEYDSFIGLGYLAADPTTLLFGSVLTPQPLDSGVFCGQEIRDGAFFRLQDDNGEIIQGPEGCFGGDDLKVPIARMTTAGDVCFQFNLQYREQGLLDNNPDNPTAPDSTSTQEEINEYWEFTASNEFRMNAPLCFDNPCRRYAEDVPEITGLNLLCPGDLTDVAVEFLGGSNVTEADLTHTLFGEGNEELSSGQGPLEFAALGEGAYVLVTEDANTCKDTVSFEVVSPAPLETNYMIEDDNSCFGEADAVIVLPDSLVTGGTGGLLFSAQDPQGSTLNPEFIDGIYTWNGLECIDGDGEFVFTVSDANGCTRKDTLQVNCPEPFDVAFASGDVVCTGDADGFIAVEASGGSGSLYLTNSTEIVPAEEGLMDLGPSIYQVYVLDSLNCSSDTAVIQINEPAALEINIGDITNPSCGLDCDGEVALTALGGSGDLDVSYFNTTTGGVSADSIGLCAGDYVATVTDTSGCQLTALFEVDAPAPLDFLIAPSNATCTGMSNGSADIFPIGGTVSDEEYDWVVLDTAGNVANLNNLSEMTYTALVTDQIGCSYAETFDIGIDFVTDMELNTLTSPVTCWNAADGTATVSVNGGEAPFTFEWSDPFAQTTSTAVGLTEDTYTVVVTDALGCRRTASQIVDAIEGCLFIADALTPNGDNSNDDWVVGGLEDYPDSKVMVFNRWGQKLFETEGGQERWDGRFNGARLPVADYYYTIELFPKALPIRGTVTIKY